MKTFVIHVFLLMALLVISAMPVHAQDTSHAVKPVYITYDEPPVPPGGEDGYKKYLEKNVKYPAEAIKAKVNGTVYISIIVGKDGSLSDVHIEKDLAGYGCGEEAVRVIEAMPAWTPGKMNGVPLKVRYVVPVRFKLP